MPESDLATLTRADWEPHVGTAFQVESAPGEGIEVTLIEASSRRGAEPFQPGARVPYSLLFRHPRRDLFLAQSTYVFSHPALGRLPIFIVPIGPDAQGMRYEALFS